MIAIVAVNRMLIPPSFNTFVLRHKQHFIKASWLVNILGMVLLTASSLLAPLESYWIKLGNLAGNAAVITFCATLIPGILKRYQVSGDLKTIQLLLMSFRRQLGIMMYFFVIEHYIWVRVLPSLKFATSIIPTSGYELAGFVAYLLLTPLALTSNNLATKKLGTKWRLLHKLVYGINWVIFIHLLLLGRGGWSLVLIYVLGMFELASHLRLKLTPITNTANTTPPTPVENPNYTATQHPASSAQPTTPITPPTPVISPAPSSTAPTTEFRHPQAQPVPTNTHNLKHL